MTCTCRLGNKSAAERTSNVGRGETVVAAQDSLSQHVDEARHHLAGTESNASHNASHHASHCICAALTTGNSVDSYTCLISH